MLLASPGAAGLEGARTSKGELMNRIAWISIASATALFLAACGGGGGGGGPTRSCNQGYVCVAYDYPDLDEAAWEQMQAVCEDAGGTWEACPAARRFGECNLTGASWGDATMVFYAGYVCSAVEGQRLCEQAADDIYAAHYRVGPATCGDPTERTVACDLSAGGPHACSSATGLLAPERVDVFQVSCADAGGISAALCPMAGRVATCSYSDDLLGLAWTLEYYAGADLTEAHDRCVDLEGAWSEVGE
jgi:hypothetical protein